MKPNAFILLVAGLTACASTPHRAAIPIEIMALSGDLVDEVRIIRSYTGALSSASRGKLVLGAALPPQCMVYPSVTIDHGGMGTMTTVSVAVRHSSGSWLGQRSYSYPAVFGSENRDSQVESLLNKSVPFVRKTVNAYCH